MQVLGSLENGLHYPEAYFVIDIGSERNFWKKAAIIAKTGALRQVRDHRASYSQCLPHGDTR